VFSIILFIGTETIPRVREIITTETLSELFDAILERDTASLTNSLATTKQSFLINKTNYKNCLLH